MNVRLAVTALVAATVILADGEPASAQADVHARAIARASCQSEKKSDAVLDATAAVEKDPDEIGPRMRLADALVDQGCYQEAVDVLQAVQESHPRNTEISAKLRDVRSLVTEQTYIEGLTQAAESAKLARAQLRCTKLADIDACDDALKSKPDDVPLLVAKGDALMQSSEIADAAAAYRHAAQLKPTDDAIKSKLTTAEAAAPKVAATSAIDAGARAGRTAGTTHDAGNEGASAANGTPTTSADHQRALAATAPRGSSAGAGSITRTSQRGASTASKQPRSPANSNQRNPTAPAPSVAALTPPPDTQTYSNDAPPGRSN